MSPADAKRADDIGTMIDEMKVWTEMASAMGNPDDAREAWKMAATLAGKVQRRTRLLAGLGRGG